jgi:CheY-like chemotaxis protein
MVYCLNHEDDEYINQVIFIKGELKKKNVPFAIIGSKEDCDNFTKYAVNTAELVLVKPVSAVSIRKKIRDYLTEQERIRQEALLLEQERIRKELAARKKHILVVDDDVLMLKLIKDYLHDKYEVATATSGRVALKFLEKKKTDLILLDYEMPDEKGPEVLEKIRENEALNDIPVVFLTGITERNKIQRALVLNPQGYLLKPIDCNKLIETIEKYVGVPVEVQ